MTTSENDKKAISVKQLVASVIGTVALSVLINKSRDWAKDYQTWLNWVLTAALVSVSSAGVSAWLRWRGLRSSDAKRR